MVGVPGSRTSQTTRTGRAKTALIGAPDPARLASRRRKNVLLLLADQGIKGEWSSALEKWGMRLLSPASLDGVISVLNCTDLAVLDVVAFSPVVLIRQGIPVIAVGSQTDAGTMIGFLEAGVEDFIDKSCSPRELVARVRAILRRSRRIPVETLTRAVPGWTIDMYSRKLLTPDGERVDLTEPELLLLRVFFESPNEVFSREELAARVFSGPDRPSAAGISRMLSALRSKLRSKQARRRLIQTVHQKGYCLMTATEGAATNQRLDENDPWPS